MLPRSFEFSPVKRRIVGADFSGGDITSDAGALLLSEIGHNIGLSRSIAGAMSDNWRKVSCEHSLEELLKQRIHALARFSS